MSHEPVVIPGKAAPASEPPADPMLTAFHVAALVGMDVTRLRQLVDTGAFPRPDDEAGFRWRESSVRPLFVKDNPWKEAKP